jgi:chemotaxis protein CheD
MRRPEVVDIVLHPGEHCVRPEGYRLRTLLGSCVSITLWQPERRIGAMSHILLHSRPSRPAGELDGRYAEEAVSLMLRDLAAWGVRPGDCEAKLFGGANMFPGQTRSEALHVGRRNGEAARALMRAHAIPVVSESLFGMGHRNVIFDTTNGHVWSRQVEVAAPGLPSTSSGSFPPSLHPRRK